MICYRYYTNKYKIDVYKDLPEKFESQGSISTYVTNINGKQVFSYDTKYRFSSFGVWKSDYLKLIKYLKIQ